MADDQLEKKIFAEELFDRAQAGETLNSDERRRAIGWAMVHRPELQTAHMVEIFRVTDRTIRDDKAWVRKQVTEETSADDIGSIIADIRMTYTRFKDRLEKSTKAAKAGTAVYLAHLKAIADYEKQYTEMLQSLGVLPKNLGAMTQVKFEFKAFSKRGVVDAIPVIDGEIIDADEGAKDLPQLTTEDEQARKGLDAEFNMSHKFRALASTDSTDGKATPISADSPDPAQVPQGSN